MTNEEVTIQREALEEFISSKIVGDEYKELVNLVVEDCVFFIPDDVIPAKELVNLVVEDCVFFILDAVIPAAIVIGPNPGSFKLGNICLNLKKTILKTMEWSLAAAFPDSKLNALRLVIATVLWIVQATKQEISDNEAMIVEWMSRENLYDHYINEKELIDRFSKYCKNDYLRDIPRQDIVDAINDLYRAKCIDIVNGNIRLCEKVWGRR